MKLETRHALSVQLRYALSVHIPTGKVNLAIAVSILGKLSIISDVVMLMSRILNSHLTFS